MVRYWKTRHGAITDVAQTHGIMTEEYKTEEINWLTGINPQLLRDVADLVQFVYGWDDERSLDVGTLPPYDPDGEVDMLVIGRATDDRWIGIAPRNDCHVGPEPRPEVDG